MATRRTAQAKSKSKSKSSAKPKAKAKSKPHSKAKAKPVRKAAKPAKKKVLAKRPAAKPARAKAPAPKRTAAPAAPVATPAASAPVGPAPAAVSPWAAFQGRFVWHDLMTTDAPAARAFYTGLFGWTVDELNMGHFTVLVLKNGERRIGTIMPEPGIPSSHWMPYVAVASVDETCKRVVELGGSVCMGGMDVPKLGRFAIVHDAQGGMFSLLTRPPETPLPPDPAAPPVPGNFCWEDLLTTDPADAARFYTALFGWSVESMPMEMPYWVAKKSGIGLGGMMQQPPDAPHRPCWMPYVLVADVDASTAKARALGAQVFVEPKDIPNVGRFAVLADTVGASFAMYRSARP